MATYAQHKAGQAVPIQHSSKAPLRDPGVQWGPAGNHGPGSKRIKPPRDTGVQYGPGGNSGPGSMRAKGKYKQPSTPAPVGGRRGV